MAIQDPLTDFSRRAREALEKAMASTVMVKLGQTDLVGSSDSLRWQKARPGKGDLALPCFKAAQRLGVTPLDLAEELVHRMLPELPPGLLALKAEQGFVNLSYDWSLLGGLVLEAIGTRQADFGRGEPTGQRVLLEHTSANPTGPFHVGRARNPLLGDTLARMLSFAGDELTTEYYVNDVGRQAAVLAYGLTNFPPGETQGKVDHLLVGSYQAANRAMERDPQVKEAIYELLEACESGDARALEQVKGSAARLLAGLEESLTNLNVTLDGFFFESSLLQEGAVEEVLERLKALKEAGQESGARFLDLARFRLPSKQQRFYFTRHNGLSLYTTRDLAYHIHKFRRCDRALNILGEDHKLQARQLAAALELLGEPAPQVIFYSFVNLPGGKMSTRQDRTVLMDDLLEEAGLRAREELRTRRPDLDFEQRERVAEALGRSSIRFNLLKVQPEKPITFRWEEALSFEGFAAPYVIYAHARACAILRRAGFPSSEEAFSSLVELNPARLGELLDHDSERHLLELMAGFPGLVQEAARSHRPHALANYLHELANAFNGFYRDCPVLNAEPEDLRLARTFLVAAFRQVMANGLELMGLDALERM